MNVTHPTIHHSDSSPPAKHDGDSEAQLHRDRVFLAVVVGVLVVLVALLFALGMWVEAPIDNGGMDLWLMP